MLSIQKPPLYPKPLYTEIPSKRVLPLYRNTPYTKIPFIPKSPLYQNPIYTEQNLWFQIYLFHYSLTLVSMNPL